MSISIHHYPSGRREFVVTVTPRYEDWSLFGYDLSDAGIEYDVQYDETGSFPVRFVVGDFVYELDSSLEQAWSADAYNSDVTNWGRA